MDNSESLTQEGPSYKGHSQYCKIYLQELNQILYILEKNSLKKSGRERAKKKSHFQIQQNNVLNKACSQKKPVN